MSDDERNGRFIRSLVECVLYRSVRVHSIVVAYRHRHS